MNFRFTILMLLTLSSFSRLRAQTPTQNLKGQLRDAANQSPLVGATVVILGTNPVRGATTDANGYFSIPNVPVGRYDIQASYVGYDPQTIPQVQLSSGKELRLEFLLKASVFTMQTVEIKQKRRFYETRNEMSTVSGRSISTEETSRYAGSLNDPARTVTGLAGVSTGKAQDNGVVIRGNAPRSVLWRLEGVEIPTPAHFAGGNQTGGGFTSVFSTNLLSSWDFYTGAFPAEYGNGTSGVFDIQFRNGNPDKREYTFQAGILGLDAAAEGPFRQGGKSSYLVNYRISSIGLIGKLAKGFQNNYQDLSFKLNFPTKKAGNFSVWGIGGQSSVFTPFRHYQVEKEDGRIKRIRRRLYENDFQQKNIGFDVAAIGTTHQIALGRKALLRTTIAATTQGYDYNSQWFTPFSDSANSGTFSPYSQIYSRTSKLTASTKFTRQFGRHLSTTTGLMYDYLAYSANAAQTTQVNQPLSGYLNATGHTSFLQPYTQWKYSLSDNFSLTGGLHLSHFSLTGETVYEPRAGLTWWLHPQHKIGLGYGRHSQREDLSVYFIRIPGSDPLANTHLKLTKSDHFVFSYDWLISDHLNLRVEPYYQRLFQVPVIPDSSFSVLNAPTLWNLTSRLTNQGTGRNYGVDFTLEHKLYRGFYYLFSASVYQAKYTGGDGVERNSLYNRNFQTNLLAGKEFTSSRHGKNRRIGVNVRATYMGGMRYSPYLVGPSLQQQTVVSDNAQLYTLQAPSQLWVDASFYIRRNRSHSATIWGIDMKNVTLQKQFTGYQYNYYTGQVDQTSLFLILPNMYYRIEF